MSTKLARLAHRIAEVSRDLTDAEADHKINTERLSRDPANAEARSRARLSAMARDECRSELALLDEAQAAAIEADQNDESKAARQKAAQHLTDAVRLLGDRNKAAKELDRTMTEFAKACSHWVKVSAEIKDNVRHLFTFTRDGQSVPKVSHAASLVSGGLEQIPGNAIVSQFDSAVRGFVSGHHLALNYTSNGKPQLSETDTAKTGARALASILHEAAAAGITHKGGAA